MNVVDVKKHLNNSIISTKLSHRAQNLSIDCYAWVNVIAMAIYEMLWTVSVKASSASHPDRNTAASNLFVDLEVNLFFCQRTKIRWILGNELIRDLAKYADEVKADNERLVGCVKGPMHVSTEGAGNSQSLIWKVDSCVSLSWYLSSQYIQYMNPTTIKAMLFVYCLIFLICIAVICWILYFFQIFQIEHSWNKLIFSL